MISILDHTFLPIIPGAFWSPIGDYARSFYGTFDGNGHKIRRLIINRSSAQYVGLFGRIGQSARVINVGVEIAAGDMVCGMQSVGGLVGWSSGIIRNSHVIGAVIRGSTYVGGLVGYNYSGSVTNCYATGSVSGSNYVGGLVGKNSYSARCTDRSSIYQLLKIKECPLVRGA
jgi:hypothetical protein